jgi:hypothetical protein
VVPTGSSSLEGSKALVIDTTPPTLSSNLPITSLSTIAGTAGNSAGETITLSVTFDGNVNGLTSGTDSTIFKVAGTGVSAIWGGTTGTSTRTLTYTVAAGQNGQATIDEAALKTALAAGIRDAAGNAFIYTANSGSIADIDSTPLPVIDTTAPSAPTIDVANSSDSGASPVDNISVITTPQVLVNLGAGSAVGDVVTLRAGTTSVGSFTLSQADVTNGSVTITASNLGGEGTYALKAYVTDLAGNVGAESATINYVLDLTNAAPTASFVSASSSSFTIFATDVDFEPSWTTLNLSTGINGLTSLNDGSDKSFDVQQQVVSVVTTLTVTDGTNSAQVVTQSGKSVQIVQGTAGVDTFNSVAASVVGVYYGFGDNDNITGGINADYIFAGDDNDTVSGRGGNDVIDLGAGSDTLVLRTSEALNGTDSVTGFTFDASDPFEKDVLSFQFGVSGGLLDQAALRGSGTSAQILNVGGTLATNTGLVVASTGIADEAAAKSFVEGLSGEAAGDVLFLLTSTDYSGSANTTVYRVDFSAVDNATLTSLAMLSGTTLSQITTANLSNWSGSSFIA